MEHVGSMYVVSSIHVVCMYVCIFLQIMMVVKMIMPYTCDCAFHEEHMEVRGQLCSVFSSAISVGSPEVELGSACFYPPSHLP